MSKATPVNKIYRTPDPGHALFILVHEEGGDQLWLPLAGYGNTGKQVFKLGSTVDPSIYEYVCDLADLGKALAKALPK